MAYSAQGRVVSSAGSYTIPIIKGDNMRAILTVEVETEGKWLVVNKRELREGMSENEQASIIKEIATLKMQWETSDVFGACPLRINVVV